MITGKFFIPWFDAGDDSVAHSFRYIPLRKAGPLTHAATMPVYVTFKSDSIEFNFQGKVGTGIPLQGKNYLFSQLPIMIIPLGDSIAGEKSRDLDSIYDRHLNLKIDDDYSFREPGGRRSREEERSRNYSDLAVFGLDECEWEKAQWKLEAGCKHKQRFLCRLLLDFLDDFFNSNVFCLSPQYYTIREAILRVSVLEGIYLKADFHLRQGKYLSVKKANKPVQDTLLRSQYLDALEKWMKFLDQPENKPLFNTRTGWFGFLDVEIMQSLKNFSLWESEGKEWNRGRDIVRTSVAKLIREYEIAKAAKIVLGKTLSPARQIVGSLLVAGVVILLIVLFWNDEGFWKKPMEALFMLLGFDLVIVFISNWYFKRSAVNLLLPRLMMAIATAWIGILSNIDYLKRGFVMTPGIALRFGALLFAVTFAFLAQEVIRKTQISDPRKVILKSLNVILPAWILSACLGLTGMVFLGKANVIHSDFFDTKSVVRDNILELRRHDDLEVSQADSVEDLRVNVESETDPRQQNSYRDDLKSASGRKRRRHDHRESSHFRSHDSLFNSLPTFHLYDPADPTYSQPDSSKDRVVYYYGPSKEDYPLMLFPGFIILMSSFALFSGIVLTLLFDDKPVTDPL
jgi:hypothetical protein